MLQGFLNLVGRSYSSARTQKFEGHELANALRRQSPEIIKDILGDLIGPEWKVQGSAGQGNWAEVPWIAVLDPLVTTTATKGYYIAYLFSADLSQVHLNLNQGATLVREEFKSQTRSVLEMRAEIIRMRVPEYKSHFSAENINLNSSGILAQDYEAGHAFGVSYPFPLTSSEEVLTRDLRKMLELYSLVTQRGGIDLISDSEGSEESDITGYEKPLYRLHRKIERNPNNSKKVKQLQGTVCQGCSFDFGKFYGPVAEGYIEAHHLTPIATLPKGERVKLDLKADFAVLCANCHRVMHQKGGPKTLNELRQLIFMAANQAKT